MSVKNIPSLSGLRGVAACWVVLFHVQVYLSPFVPSARLGQFVESGFLGVDLFFVLSGFVLMHVHEHDFNYIRVRQLVSFAVLRISRVYPLNAVILLAIFVFVVLTPGFVADFRRTDPTAFSGPGFIQTLTLSTRWIVPDLGHWNDPTWSLSAEILGYIVFPFICYFACRLRSEAQGLWLSAACLGALVVYVFATGDAMEHMIGRAGLIRMITCFTAGIFLRRSASIGRVRSPAGVTFIGAAGAVACAVVPAAQPYTVFAFAALIYGLLGMRGAIDAALSGRVALFLGRISFSLYLVHFTPLLVLRWALKTQQVPASMGTLLLIIVLALSVLAAWALNTWIERPFQKMGRALAHSVSMWARTRESPSI